MAAPESDRLTIHKAGKATAILQFFAVGLIVVLGFIYHDISERYSTLQSGVRENAMWSVYQLDREARTLTNTLAVMIASGDLGRSAQKNLSTRYDILYSRMDLLEKAKFEQYFTVDDQIASRLKAIQATVFGNVAAFDAIARGETVPASALAAMLPAFRSLLTDTEELVTYTNHTLSEDRADSRASMIELEQRSLVLIGFLGLIVCAVIVLLRRQLDSVRAAGRSFESMAASLKQAYAAADAGNRAKSQFMATMSHEIRTPLNAILGTVELMELAPSTPDCAKNLSVIRHSGRALLEIINEILDYAKIESGKLELDRCVVDIGALAGEVVDMVRGRAVEGGNRLVFEAPDLLQRPYIATDMARLRQVMLNLLSNALKFTHGGTVTLALEEFERAGQPHLRIEIRDTGIGIDEAGRARLFQPFSQVDASIARRYGGTGLGLTICKEIIERLGGRIGVDSRLGEGSTFWFEIPVEVASKAEASAAAPETDRAPLPTLRILLVEDNAVNTQVATRFLAHLGQLPDTAEDGSVAVAKAAKFHYDLILMDMQMPVMDGIEATRLIRAGSGPSAGARIVAMTANASDDDRAQCARAGMDGFQSKPLTIAALHGVLAEAAEAVGARVDMSGMATGDRAPASPPVPADIAGSRGNMSVSPDMTDFLARKRELVEVLGEDDFAELLDGCFEDCARTMARLREAVAREEASQEVDRLLHSIKGAAGNVGLANVAHLSQSLRGVPLDRQGIERLEAELDGMRRALAA